MYRRGSGLQGAGARASPPEGPSPHAPAPRAPSRARQKSSKMRREETQPEEPDLDMSKLHVELPALHDGRAGASVEERCHAPAERLVPPSAEQPRQPPDVELESRDDQKAMYSHVALAVQDVAAKPQEGALPLHQPADPLRERGVVERVGHPGAA
eukprot:CAMPEP_0179279752 /NCGR_PEP_ID=MMETSP0797-20121207/36276_1 /TAXON_ID=47934 /ORGANISM="Dinophysis acuminata, Strain DAEP01" /LENGTH=154 /DNA_ID=CAMNT_0020988391 /DNA_START=211 /DNA_END=672 /DNA_ORIENTATION=-